MQRLNVYIAKNVNCNLLYIYIHNFFAWKKYLKLFYIEFLQIRMIILNKSFEKHTDS